MRYKVIDSEPIGVICIYELKLACGHTVELQTYTNRVPKSANCPKCKTRRKPNKSTLQTVLHKLFPKQKRKP